MGVTEMDCLPKDQDVLGIGVSIKELIKSLGLTEEEAARLLGIDLADDEDNKE